MNVNNNYSPNFGMALKIKPGAAEKLKTTSMEYLAGIRKIGEELKNHKHVDLELNESLKPIIRLRGCCDAYDGRHLRPEAPISNGFSVLTRWEGGGNTNIGSEIRTYLTFANEKEAVEAYKSLANASQKGSLDAAVEFTKLKEKSLAYKALIKAQEAEQQAKIDAEVGKLLSEFVG